MLDLLIDEYTDKFKLNFNNVKDELFSIKEISKRNFQSHNYSSKYQDNDSDDLLGSLVLMRTIDVAITRRTNIPSIYKIGDNSDISNKDINYSVRPSDLKYSISTMPCNCPYNFPCCINMRTYDVNFIIGFDKDRDVLKKLGVFSFKDLVSKYGYIKDNILSRYQDVLRESQIVITNINDLRKLLESKVDIWKRSVDKIAVPLIKIFNREI